MSIAAYKRTIRESENPRQIERRVMSQINLKLESFAERYDAAESRIDKLAILSDGLREGLTENAAAWAIMKFDLSSEGNALPPQLRASLISLALWVERQTSAVLGGENGVRALVEVNRNIIDGLSGRAPRPIG